MKRIIFLLFVITACISCKTKQEPDMLESEVTTNGQQPHDQLRRIQVQNDYLSMCTDSDAYYQRDFEDHMDYLYLRDTYYHDGLYDKAYSELAEYGEILTSDILSGIETYIMCFGTEQDVYKLQHRNYRILTGKSFSYMSFTSGGFAIFCNDNRSPYELIYYSDNGTFDSDYFSEYNNIVAYILDLLYAPSGTDRDASIKKIIGNRYSFTFADMVNFHICTKTFFEAIPYNYIPCPYTFFPYYNHSINLLPWTQTNPFNQYCVGFHPTGTIPLSIAKILTRLGYEESINGTGFPSSTFISGQNMDKLYQALGYFYTQVQSLYSDGVTIGNTSAGLTLLNNLGVQTRYLYAGSYTSDTIQNQLTSNKWIIGVQENEWYVIVGLERTADCDNYYEKIQVDYNNLFIDDIHLVTFDNNEYDLIICDYTPSI